MELYSENATEMEILDTSYAITLDCDVNEAKIPVLDFPNLMELEPRLPIAQELP